MFRIDYNSPEWQLIREELEKERDVALQNLVKKGLSEGEYHQWRGRVHLTDKLLGLGKTPNGFTE